MSETNIQEMDSAFNNNNISDVNRHYIENNNNSNSDKRDENLAIMEVTILAAIFVMIMVGNTLVLIALAAKRFKMTRMYYFLLHLCISDLITGLCTVLPQLAWDITYRFNGGNVLCKLVKCLQIMGPYLSSYVLVVTAIDRYQAICFPLTNCQWTSRKSKLMIAFAWIVSLSCCAPQAFIFSYQEIPGTNGIHDCWGTFPQPWGERIYVTWYAISIFFVPLVIITYTYVFICREVWTNVHRKRQTLSKAEISLIEVRRNLKHRKAENSANNDNSDNRNHCQNSENSECGCKDNNRNAAATTSSTSSSTSHSHTNALNPRSHSIYRISKAKIKTVKVTVVVVICYIVCSSPFILVQLWAYWYPGARDTAFWKGKQIIEAIRA